MEIFAIAIAGIVLVVNLAASRAVLRSPYYDRRQKVSQLFVVWLVPVLGGCLVWALALPPKTDRATTDYADRRGSMDDGHVRLDSAATDVGGGAEGGGSD